MSLTNYDRIAEIYDVDMGRNMAFDDTALYVDVCRGSAGVLELGCGNGRILLELLAHGVPAMGIDASERMLAVLRRKAAARGIAPPALCRMDVRALAFSPAFDVVLCPYSLATYLVSDAEFGHMARGIRAALRANGMVVIDAFVPRRASSAGFDLDYRRAHEDGELARWKRITRLAGGLNRIERRYQRYGWDGTLLETIEVVEEIRPLTPDHLRALVTANGFAIEREWWNYRADADAERAQFFTVAARAK